MNVLDVLKLHKDGLLKIMAIVLVLSTISGFFHFGVLYYIILGLFGLMLIVLMLTKGDVVYFRVIIFLVICAFSLIINNPPAIFKAWNRLGVYVLLLFVVSPMVSNALVNVKRRKILFYIMDVCILLSVLSFFCYFLGINLFVRRGEVLEIGMGTFSGLMNHSMVLGPISGLSSVVLLSYCLCEINGRKRILYIAATICCLGSCLFSASRIAVGAVIVGSVFTLYQRFRYSLTKFTTVLLAVLALGGITFPIWGGATDLLVQKQQSNIEMGGSLMSSREVKIDARIEEFKSSPIIGIGFATADPSLDYVNMENGQIEPGSSWLAILSMTGILGLFYQFAYQLLRK